MSSSLGSGTSTYSSDRSAQNSNRYNGLEGLGTTLSDDEKIALPFVYVRKFPQYYACDRFDIHGQKLFVVRTTKPNFCPFLLICFQIGEADFFANHCNNVEDVIVELENCLFNNCQVTYISPLSSIEGVFKLDHCYFDNDSVCQTGQTQLSIICSPNNLYGLDPMFRDPANGDDSSTPLLPPNQRGLQRRRRRSPNRSRRQSPYPGRHGSTRVGEISGFWG